MTTVIQNKIEKITVDGVDLRSVDINKKKYYYLNDLIKIYGGGFRKNLPSNPIHVCTGEGHDVRYRYLVSSADFKEALTKSQKLKRNSMPYPVRKPVAVKATAAYVEAPQMELDLPFSEPTTDDIPMDFVNAESAAPQPVTALPEVKRYEISASPKKAADKPLQAKQISLKAEIWNLCVCNGQKIGFEKGMTFEEILVSPLTGEAYSFLYKEFDKELKKKFPLQQIKDWGLCNYYSKSSNVTYTAAIENAGLLPALREKAVELYA